MNVIQTCCNSESGLIEYIIYYSINVSCMSSPVASNAWFVLIGLNYLLKIFT